MRYLGSLSGEGTMKVDGIAMARASYDFEGYAHKVGRNTGAGEIQMAADDLKSLFGRHNLQLLTDDGFLLDLTFSDKDLQSADRAHVEVSGDLPPGPVWRR